MIALTVVPAEGRAFLAQSDDERILEFDISGNAEVCALASELVGALGSVPFRINVGDDWSGDFVVASDSTAETLGRLGSAASAVIRGSVKADAAV